MTIKQRQEKPPTKRVWIAVRVEEQLAKRLRDAAVKSEITASDKVRRILDQALPAAQ